MLRFAVITVLLTMLCGEDAVSQWRDSAGTLIPSPSGKPVRIKQFAIGDTNTRKISGSIAYTNGGFYVANGSYYVRVGGGSGSTGNSDSLGGVPASDYARLSVANTFTQRNTFPSVAVDTVVANTAGNTLYIQDTVNIKGKLTVGTNNLNNGYDQSYIFGYQDTILSTASAARGQNYIFGRLNTIGRTNPTGTYGNWLFGQYLRSENLGLWAFGADDDFQKKIIPFEGSIVFVNENVKHWGSNSMGLLGYMNLSYGIQSPHVKDTLLFTFRYDKRGSASDDTGYAALHYELHRQFARTSISGEVTKIGSEGARIKRIYSINQNDDDAWHFNTYNTSGRPFGNIYVDSAHFIVSQGYADADSFRLNGSTFLNSTALSLGSKTVTTTGAGSFGALSGTTITASSYVDGDDSVFTSAADSWMGAESGGITPRLAFVKASGFGPELRFLSSSASLFTVRRVTGGTLLAPTASTVDLLFSSTGNATFSGNITTATGTISGTILDGDSVALESTTEPSIRLTESGNSGFRLSYDGDGTNDFIIGAGTGGTFTPYLSMARANGALTLSAPQVINSGLNTIVLTLSDVTTDATAKLARFGSKHYTNSEEPVAISYSNNTTSANTLNWGGGTGLMNAATVQNWYIGATNTTTTGTLSMLLDANGLEVNNKVIADSSFTINERSTTPTLPTSNTQMHMYMKGDKVVWVINAAGTPRYYYFDASATADQQIIYSATAP